MPVPFIYVSFLTQTATDAAGARNLSYLQVIGPPPWTGGTVTTTGSGAPASYFAASNNVTFGSNGTVVTASASYTWGHVAPARSAAWEELGVRVASASPSDPIQYSQWTGGSSGHWGWVQLP